MKCRVASVTFVVLALILVSLTVCAPTARATSWDEAVLHSFDNTDGKNPVAGVSRGSDGNFYGTTQFGGASPGDGTVFKLTPSGTLTILHSFCSEANCADGTGPQAGVIQGSDGNFYGTTTGGGVGISTGGGTVFKVTPSGTLTTLYKFCSQANCTDGKDPLGVMIQGSDGNFYGTTYGGGANASNGLGGGTVFKITPSGTLTTLYSFCSVVDSNTRTCLDGEAPVAGVIQGSDGNFYGTTATGGANYINGSTYGTAFKLTPSGTLTTLYSFCSVFDSGTQHCLDGFNPFGGVIQGGDGNFYGTTSEGGANQGADNGAGQGTVFELTPSGTLTTLYSFCSQANCADGTEPHAGVIQLGDGNFYGTTLRGGANFDSASSIYGGTVFQLMPSGMLTTLYSFCSKANCTDGEEPHDGVIQDSGGTFYGTTYGGGVSNDGTVFSSSTPSRPTTATLTYAPKRLRFRPAVELGGVGASSAPRTVTLFNPLSKKQNVTVSITGFAVSAPTGDFGQDSSTTNCGNTIAPNARCNVGVTFSPTGAGQRTGTLTITTDASGSPTITVPLGGEGLQGKLTYAPKSLNFGKVTSGTTSGAKTVNVANKNPVPMSLTVATSAPFAQTNNCPATLAANGSCSVQVTFAPTAAGKMQGALTFTDTAVGSPQSVKLIGIGK